MTMLLIVLGLSIVVAAVIVYGEFRWKWGTRELRDRIDSFLAVASAPYTLSDPQQWLGRREG